MKTVVISGVIGWDVSAKEVRAALDAAGGEPVEIQISSPGGVAMEALEMRNLIRNYKGPKTARIMGEAASGASYISTAADRVIAEDNVVYMIHNAQGGALGDHNTMRKAATILDGLSRIIAQAYAEKAKKPIAQIRTTMDDEGWYFGVEAMDAGFVDEIVPAPADAQKDKAAALAMARARVAACRKIIGEVETTETLEQAVALAGGVPAEPKQAEPAGVAGVTTAAKADGISKSGGVKKMTLEEMKKDHPDLYAAVTKDAREVGVVEGVAGERARVAKLEGWLAADAGNAKVAVIVAEAKATGKSEADVMPQLQVAVRDGAGKDADPDNPPAVGTQAASASAVSTDPAVQAEIARMAPKMGVTLADVKKFGGAQEGGK